MKIVDIKTPTFYDKSLANAVERYCVENIGPAITNLWRNYQPEFLKIEDHLIFSALVDNQEILAFSGIYNGGRYPEGVYRILNRLFVSPVFRRRHLISPKSHWRVFSLINHQLPKTLDYLDIAFVSFEKESRSKVLPAVCKHIEAIPNESWSYSSKRYRVASGNDKPCYQIVAWANITRKFSEFPLESIDSRTYRQLEG